MSDAPACIVHTHKLHQRESWCGRRLAGEDVYTSLDQAAYSQVREAERPVCTSCIAVAVAALSAPGGSLPGWATVEPETPARAGGLMVDLGPIRAFVLEMEALGVAWGSLSASQRAGLSRMLWLHPGGKVVPYTTNVDGEPKK